MSTHDDRRGSTFLKLVEVMDTLRSPGGCPWDQEQTHASLVPYAIEEAYEVAEAVDVGTPTDLVEELGDLLLQVVFHARIGQEDSEPFDIDDVCDVLIAKLVRRHPHVFADTTVQSADEVRVNWDRIKKDEKQRSSILEGIPRALPALSKAQKVIARARRADMSIPDRSAQDSENTIGTSLLTLVREAQEQGIDAESALRTAVAELEADIIALEKQ